jgi:hypothetical protein
MNGEVLSKEWFYIVYIYMNVYLIYIFLIYVYYAFASSGDI